MNKFYIFGLAALSLGIISCDEIDDPKGLPQTNPQETIVEASNVTCEPAGSIASVISLDVYNNNGELIQVAKVTKGGDWPEGFEVVVPNIEVSKTAAFTEIEIVEAQADSEGVVSVSPDLWEAAYLKIFGKNPVTTTSYIRFPVWAVNGNQKVRIGTLSTYFGNYEVKVKPFDLYNGRIVEEEYYLLTSEMNWDLSKAVPMRRNNPEADLYSDANFTSPAVIVNGAGFEWMVVPATAIAANNITTQYASFGLAKANDEANEGSLVANVGGSKAIPGLINVTGPYIFSVDMEQLTYKIQLAYENLYTPGDANGWNFGACQMLTTTNYNDYYGYAHLSGSFKFTTAPDWNSGVAYGIGAEEGQLSSAGGNLPVPADNLYWCHANLSDLTYALTEINTIGLIGSATDKGWEGDTPMAVSSDLLVWTVTVSLSEGEFKFRANSNWDINLGGSLDNLVKDGDNLKVTEAGTYVVVLNLSAIPYTATMTKQ